jgi:hypothetical protein
MRRASAVGNLPWEPIGVKGGKSGVRWLQGDYVRVRKAISLITIAVCVLLCGCRGGPTTIWSTESRSPNGYWVAVARSEQWSGPGNAYRATTVDLKRTNGSTPPTQILLSSHESPTIDLKMEWISPVHLNVTYGEHTTFGKHVSLDFQVVKCAGIEISVRDLSGDGKDSR